MSLAGWAAGCGDATFEGLCTQRDECTLELFVGLRHPPSAGPVTWCRYLVVLVLTWLDFGWFVVGLVHSRVGEPAQDRFRDMASKNIEQTLSF